MKKVFVLTTGGTIASKLNPKTGLYTSSAMNGDELIDRGKITFDSAIQVETFCQMPSNSMTFTVLLQLRDRIHEIFLDKNVQGIVITQGTDTLEETSYFLSLCVDDERPVIITGSQRTTQEVGSDAYSNIQDALIAAANPVCRGLGVVVLFNEALYMPRYVHKMHTFNTAAFASLGFGMLGYVDGDCVHIAQVPANRETYVPKSPIPLVEIVTSSLGANGILIDAAVKAGAQGLILEGFGRGHIPPEACESVSQAVDAGMHVIITSDCEVGRVFSVYDFKGGVKDLEIRGAIQGFDYAAKKARLKLGILLASGITSRKDVSDAVSR